MFPISLPNSLFFLEVESDHGFICLFYGFLLLHACGGITVSRRPHAVDARPRRLRESMTTSRRRVDGVGADGTPSGRRHARVKARLDGDRRGPNQLKLDKETTHDLLSRRRVV